MVLSAFCLALVTAGCSGDDDKDKKKASNEPSSVITGDPKDEKQLVAKTAKCTAEVSTSGEYEAEWGGDAQVRTGGKSADDTGPNAIYTLNDKQEPARPLQPRARVQGQHLHVGRQHVVLQRPGRRRVTRHRQARQARLGRRHRSPPSAATRSRSVAEFTCGKTKQQ